MIVFPAIDVYDKCCVRLKKGDYNEKTVYSEDLVGMAKSFEEAGAEFLHMVDLNAARSGEPTNYGIIGEVARAINIPVQVGGGVRTLEACEELFKLGVNRVIVGTLAVTNTELFEQMVAKYGEKIVVSLDVKDEKVAIKGWEELTDKDLYETCEYLEKLGVRVIVCTDIAKDGMLQGPNFDIYEKLKEKTNLDVIVSGGITDIEDIRKVKTLGTYGVITGKAIYDKRLDLKEAILCSQNV